MRFWPEHPKWDQNPKSDTTSTPAPFKWESPRATCPDHCYEVPESHEAVGCPGHCSFSWGTGCPDHCCSLPPVLTLPTCPSERHISCHELCPMHCCKIFSFTESLCPSHCKTACDHLCPSHCCSQQLTPATVPMQPMCNPVCQPSSHTSRIVKKSGTLPGLRINVN